MRMICNIVITQEDDSYVARDLRTNVADQGDTIEEALANIKEALELYYDDNDEARTDGILYTTSLEVCV